MTGVDVRGSCAGSVRPGCIVALSLVGLLRYGSTDWREAVESYIVFVAVFVNAEDEDDARTQVAEDLAFANLDAKWDVSSVERADA